ncbi:hypothetical protein RF095_07560, partial [Serratia marcescens]|nr:hypothetical protein [Serratia marcescens]
LYNSKRPHKSLELMTPVDYILRESKNCNMWWTHTRPCRVPLPTILCGMRRRAALESRAVPILTVPEPYDFSGFSG